MREVSCVGYIPRAWDPRSLVYIRCSLVFPARCYGSIELMNYYYYCSYNYYYYYHFYYHYHHYYISVFMRGEQSLR